MTADVELLPLPKWMDGYTIPSDDLEHDGDIRLSERMRDYARANVAHVTAAKDAEIEALRAEVERLNDRLATANANHETFERRWYLEQDRAERLAEALRFARTRFAPYMDDTDRAAFDAALHPTAAQEGE